MLDTYYEKGLKSIQRRDFQQAIEDFSRSIFADASSSAYANRAFCYYRLENFEEAVHDYEKAIDMTVGLINKADENDKRYVTQCFSDLARNIATIGQIQTERSNFIEAEKQYDELLSIHEVIKGKVDLPTESHIGHAYFNRGMAKLQQSKSDAAVRDFAAGYYESADVQEIRQGISMAVEMFGLNSVFNSTLQVYSMLKGGRR